MAILVSNYKMKQLQADTLTPISVFQALNGQNKVLFESSAKHEESGRYSFIAMNPTARLQGDENGAIYTKNGEQSTYDRQGVLDVCKQVLPKIHANLPFSFFGGAIGHFSYETAYHVERIGEKHPNEVNIPDVHLMFYESFIVFDHLHQTLTIAVIDLWNEGKSEEGMDATIAEIEAQIKESKSYSPIDQVQIQFQPTIEKEHFISIVETAKEHIKKGDIFQVVLSQRFEAEFNDDPFSLYRKLRTVNASPYMFYVEFGDYTVLGTSPESLVKINGSIVTTNPIAGTKKRGATREEDYLIGEALLKDEKEIAEHKMLVDLGRNDIGRVSEVGTVKVTKYMQIERYKHVMHIVSEVSGKLRVGVDAIDVIKACLPAGTVSGAPKIRAMQIINHLETTRRNIYAGAIGYISATGDMDLALAIRTMVVKDGKAYVQAGAGVVYDSIPASEYEETWNKAKALLEVQR